MNRCKTICLVFMLTFGLLTSAVEADILANARANATRGNPESQYMMGMVAMHADRYTEAYQWYLAAAKQNHARAQSALGFMYASGQQGLPLNYQRAHLWFSLAAEAGDYEARRYRDNIAKALSPTQLAGSMLEARRWRTFFSTRHSRR